MELSVYITLVSARPQDYPFFPFKFFPESFYLGISAETFKKECDYMAWFCVKKLQFVLWKLTGSYVCFIFSLGPGKQLQMSSAI